MKVINDNNKTFCDNMSIANAFNFFANIGSKMASHIPALLKNKPLMPTSLIKNKLNTMFLEPITNKVENCISQLDPSKNTSNHDISIKFKKSPDA